ATNARLAPIAPAEHDLRQRQGVRGARAACPARIGRVLRRSLCLLATRHKRKHQWAAPAVLSQANRLHADQSPQGGLRARQTQRPSSSTTRLPNPCGSDRATPPLQLILDITAGNWAPIRVDLCVT